MVISPFSLQVDLTEEDPPLSPVSDAEEPEPEPANLGATSSPAPAHVVMIPSGSRPTTPIDIAEAISRRNSGERGISRGSFGPHGEELIIPLIPELVPSPRKVQDRATVQKSLVNLSFG